MLADFTTWLLNLLKQAFQAAWDFLGDVVVWALDQVVGAFVFLINAIPVPSWLSGGLGSLFGGLDGGVMYVVTQCGLPAALAVIGGGYAFRLARKFFTLFQW